MNFAFSLYSSSSRQPSDLRSGRPKVTLLRYEIVRPKEHGSELTVKLSKAGSGEEPTEASIHLGLRP